MQFDNDQRKLTLKTSIVWSLSGVLNDNNFLLLGSWTFFKYEAVVPEYLPVNPRLPDYKESLDFFLEVFDELEEGDSLTQNCAKFSAKINIYCQNHSFNG